MVKEKNVCACVCVVCVVYMKTYKIGIITLHLIIQQQFTEGFSRAQLQVRYRIRCMR